MPDGVAVCAVPVARQGETAADAVPVSVEVASFDALVRVVEQAAAAKDGAIRVRRVLGDVSDELLGEAVMRGVRAGEAFDELYRRHVGKARGWFRKRLLSVMPWMGSEQFEELVQETFATALEWLKSSGSRRPHLDAETGHEFGRWLFGWVARHVLLEYQQHVRTTLTGQELEIDRLVRDGALRPDCAYGTGSDGQGVVLAQMCESSFTVEAFLTECCHLDPEHTVGVAELFDAWSVWRENNGCTAGTRATFGRTLNKAVPNLQSRRLQQERQVTRMYVGVSLTSPPKPAPLHPIDSETPSGAPPADESMLGQLAVALARLTPAQREVLQVRYLEDQWMETCAEITGRTQSSAWGLHNRALDYLREALGGATCTHRRRLKDVSRLRLAKPWTGYIRANGERYKSDVYVFTPEGERAVKVVHGATRDIVRQRVAELLTQLNATPEAATEDTGIAA